MVWEIFCNRLDSLRHFTLCQCDGFRAGVRLGEHNMDTDIDCTEDEEEGEVCAEPHVDFDIEESIAHPNYSTSHLQNDIALIRIKGIANLRSGDSWASFLTICHS